MTHISAAEAVERRFRVGRIYRQWKYAIGSPGGKSRDAIVNGTGPLWGGDHFGVFSRITEESSQMYSYYRINPIFSLKNLLMAKSVKEEMQVE